MMTKSRSGGMADAPDSKSGPRKWVWVQVPPSAVVGDRARAGRHCSAMISTLFRFDTLQAARRQRGFFLRWLYAAFVLAQIAPIFFLSQPGWARLLLGFDVYDFFQGILTQHYVLLTLLTPAMVGGAITEEKTRGTLEHLLTTQLRPGEIIL